jgi:hypothetical protein
MALTDEALKMAGDSTAPAYHNTSALHMKRRCAGTPGLEFPVSGFKFDIGTSVTRNE